MTNRAAFNIGICTLLLAFSFGVVGGESFAQVKKKKKKKKVKSAIKVAPASQFKPTVTGAKGTVKYYFFPTDVGTQWTLRTIQSLSDQKGRTVHSDTLFTTQQVIDSARFSLQRLPLVVTSDSSYQSGREGIRSESAYYIDDSVAMTVFNNSVTHGENRVFLVSPIKVGSNWPEKFEDTTFTTISAFTDSVMTPSGRFDSVLVTLTQKDFSDMRKYYAPRRGIIKSIYRSPGPNGRGLFVRTTEILAFKPAHSEIPEQKLR